MTPTRFYEEELMRRIIGSLAESGYGPTRIEMSTGEEGWDLTVRPEAAVEKINRFVREFDDVSFFLYCRHPGDDRDSWVVVVPGNGEDFITDHSTDLTAPLQRVYDWIEAD